MKHRARPSAPVPNPVARPVAYQFYPEPKPLPMPVLDLKPVKLSKDDLGKFREIVDANFAGKLTEHPGPHHTHLTLSNVRAKIGLAESRLDLFVKECEKLEFTKLLVVGHDAPIYTTGRPNPFPGCAEKLVMMPSETDSGNDLKCPAHSIILQGAGRVGFWMPVYNTLQGSVMVTALDPNHLS